MFLQIQKMEPEMNVARASATMPEEIGEDEDDDDDSALDDLMLEPEIQLEEAAAVKLEIQPELEEDLATEEENVVDALLDCNNSDR
jgi:hypothetical protein